MKPSQYLKSKKGSSSVLVILIVLVLVVFGTLALMSSYADLKLSRKSGDWTRHFYALDSKGELLLESIDSLLHEAAFEASQYIEDRLYQSTTEGMPGPVQTQLRSGWLVSKGSPAAEQAFINRLYKKLYYFLAVQKLEAMNSDDTIRYTWNVQSREKLFEDSYLLGNDGVMKVRALITHGDGNSLQGLDIALDILSPDSIYTSRNGIKQAPLFDIIKWKQLPSQFEYIADLELWDGEVDNQ